MKSWNEYFGSSQITVCLKQNCQYEDYDKLRLLDTFVDVLFTTQLYNILLNHQIFPSLSFAACYFCFP